MFVVRALSAKNGVYIDFPSTDCFIVKGLINTGNCFKSFTSFFCKVIDTTPLVSLLFLLYTIALLKPAAANGPSIWPVL